MRTLFPGINKFIPILLLLILIISCSPQGSVRKRPLTENGEVILYLQPLPKPAENILFTIDSITVMDEDGVPVPLTLALNKVSGPESAGRQKMLAYGEVPSGRYTAISISIGNASIKGKGGEAALLVPEGPVIVNHVFRAVRGKSSTLFLDLAPAGFISEGFLFNPSFIPAEYGRELHSLTGYITGSDTNTISIFNKKKMLVAGAISTGSAPMGIVLDQDRGLAYAAVSGDDAIIVIDIFKGEITGRVRLNSGDEPVYLGLAPDAHILVSVNNGSNSVSLIDTNALFEVGRVAVDEGPVSAVIDPSGLNAFVINSMSNSVSVIDLSSRTLSATISVEGTPVRGAFSRNGDTLYVIKRDAPDLAVINASSRTVTGKIFIGTGAVSITVDTRTGIIFAGNKSGGEISVIDPVSSMFIDTVRTGGTAAYMTIDDQENALFVLVPERKNLLKINLTSKEIIGEIDVSEGAFAVVLMGER